MTARFGPVVLGACGVLLGLIGLGFGGPCFGARASAQATPPDPLPIHIDGADDLDPEQLRTALAEDLGVTVRLGGPNEAQLIIERDGPGVLRLTVRLPDAPARTRAVEAIEDRSEATLAVALIAANLVRNESAELVALLATLRPATPDAPPSEPPRPRGRPRGEGGGRRSPRRRGHPRAGLRPVAGSLRDR